MKTSFQWLRAFILTLVPAITTAAATAASVIITAIDYVLFSVGTALAPPRLRCPPIGLTGQVNTAVKPGGDGTATWTD